MQGPKQLEAAFKYFDKLGQLPVNKQELEQSCGVGVTVLPSALSLLYILAYVLGPAW